MNTCFWVIYKRYFTVFNYVKPNNVQPAFFPYCVTLKMKINILIISMLNIA